MRKYTDNAWFSALFLPLCGLLVLGTLLWLQSDFRQIDTATRCGPMAASFCPREIGSMRFIPIPAYFSRYSPVESRG